MSRAQRLFIRFNPEPQREFMSGSGQTNVDALNSSAICFMLSSLSEWTTMTGETQPVRACRQALSFSGWPSKEMTAAGLFLDSEWLMEIN